MQVIRIFKNEGIKLSELFEKCVTISIDQVIEEVECKYENGGSTDECNESQ